MKVRIGPYPNSITLYSILEYLPLSEENFDKVYAWFEDGLIEKAFFWYAQKQERKVDVRIDRSDTWNMDHTLALIILPMLKQLKESKHGAPYVDDEDVPEFIRSTTAPPKENEWDTDKYFFLRWEWVLEEMIYAFEKIADEDWQWEYLDKETFEVYNNRVDNGLRLFGKYYRSLWD